jgi:MFS family permease
VQSQSLYRNRNFVYLWGGRGVSEFGDFFGELAISWLVYVETSSPLALGASWLAFLLPRSAIRLWGGVYVDRYDRKKIMLMTETTRAILFGLLGILVIQGYTSLPLVYSVSFLVGLLGALFDLASDAVLPLIIEKESLFTANSLFTSTFQIDNIVGPAAAGVAIRVLGTGIPMLVDSASFVVLVVALILMKVPQVSGAPRKSAWLSNFKEGLDFFRKRSELVWLAFMVAGINFGLGAFWYVYVLPFARDVLLSGSTGYGLIGAFSALGIFSGSVLLGKRGGIRRRRLSVVSSFVAMSVFIILISFTRSLVHALAVIFAFGASIPFIDIVATTYYQESVPQELMGRVFGVRHFINYVSLPASIVFGIAATFAVGVTTAILVSGLIMLAFALVSVFAKPLSRLDLPRPPD